MRASRPVRPTNTSSSSRILRARPTPGSSRPRFLRLLPRPPTSRSPAVAPWFLRSPTPRAVASGRRRSTKASCRSTRWIRSVGPRVASSSPVAHSGLPGLSTFQPVPSASSRAAVPSTPTVTTSLSPTRSAPERAPSRRLAPACSRSTRPARSRAGPTSTRAASCSAPPARSAPARCPWRPTPC